MDAKTCISIEHSNLFFSTIVAPFDKSDVSKMKTTNDIERSVLNKIFSENQPEALGIIENHSGEITVRILRNHLIFLE